MGIEYAHIKPHQKNPRKLCSAIQNMSSNGSFCSTDDWSQLLLPQIVFPDSDSIIRYSLANVLCQAEISNAIINL